MSATREDVVREALSWVGTPFADCCDKKGVGVDCGMLLVRVFCGLNLAPPFDPRPYSPEFHLHHSEPLYMDWLRKYSHRVEVPQPGDVALYQFGKIPSHGAIVVDANSIVHAYKPARRVCLDGNAQYARRLHSCWSAFP